jgi:hypothetical protein
VYSRLVWTDINDINVFSSTSDVCFMLEIQGFVTTTGKIMVDANRPGGTVRHSQLPPLQAFHAAVQYVIHSFHLYRHFIQPSARLKSPSGPIL